MHLAVQILLAEAQLASLAPLQILQKGNIQTMYNPCCTSPLPSSHTTLNIIEH